MAADEDQIRCKTQACRTSLNRRQVPAMLAKVCSAAVNGIAACPVEVEVNAGWGTQSPNSAVKSREPCNTRMIANGSISGS